MSHLRIVLCNWRDLGDPKAGGAEVATDQLLAGLAARGHDVTWLTSRSAHADPSEDRHGYRVVRFGTQLTCRFFALTWLWKNRDRIDIVIDEVNTLPFLSRLLARHRVVVWMHQLAREVWLAEAPGIIGRIGYLLEPWFMSIYRTTPIVTISQSSAESFRAFGLRGPITVAEIALKPPVNTPPHPVSGRIGYVGRIVPSKRVDDIFRAFAIVRVGHPDAELHVIGDGEPHELARLKRLADKLNIRDSLVMHGRVSADRRDSLMATFDVVVMASLREGWGLVVSEAARFGVPAAVYPVAGVIDSVRNDVSGIITSEPTPAALAQAITTIIGDRATRARLGDGAKAYLKRFDNERFIGRFESVLMSVSQGRSMTYEPEQS